MSSPAYVQFSFKIKENMPKDMKKLILYAFTDYYEKYYPEPDYHKDIRPLYDKYPEIYYFCRDDSYHNTGMQMCQLDEHWEVYDIDTKLYYDSSNEVNKKGLPKHIGIYIVTLPRNKNDVDAFLKLVEPYICSNTSTIGICQPNDYSDECYYYYFDKDKKIKNFKIVKPVEE